MKGYKLSLLTALIAGYAISHTATAQTPALEEVLVTAQKRVQSLKDVPISVNAIGGEKLEKDGITSIERMADETVPQITGLAESLLEADAVAIPGLPPAERRRESGSRSSVP